MTGNSEIEFRSFEKGGRNSAFTFKQKQSPKFLEKEPKKGNTVNQVNYMEKFPKQSVQNFVAER